MSNNEKNVTVVKYDYTIEESLDVLKKYKSELFGLLADKLVSPFTITIIFSDNNVECIKKIYTSETYKQYVDIILKQFSELSYLLSVQDNGADLILELLEEYLECILLNDIIDESNQKEIISLVREFLNADLEIRRNSTSYEDYFVKQLDMLKNTDLGNRTMDLLNQYLSNTFIDEYLETFDEEEYNEIMKKAADPYSYCDEFYTKEMVDKEIEFQVDNYKSTIEKVDRIINKIKAL